MVGKTEESYLKTGFAEYCRRLGFYNPFEWTEIPSPKGAGNMTVQQLLAKEASLIAKHVQPGEFLVLLDEHGREFSSQGFAGFLQKQFQSGAKNLVFVIGGPYGFDDSLKKSANMLLSLSKMTYSHQMVRLFFAEQLYRAMTIIRGESYHHE